ncbi:ABC transporter ATP-binding protein [Pseudomonas mandelii]|uniref:ABC transporter ATP-binding protein n=1 Tax=Pseudomonas mandelii TaxID=75612 RepID=UPI0020A22222|nr:ABC transporter ATP-binding protein [Pseudomonas mandelii]MCO8312171.1 ABC transporter ATP-binding protein [Pseudomonas mandelii]
MSSELQLDTIVPSIIVDNVSKNYHVYAKTEDRLKQFVYTRLSGKKKTFYRDFWALNPLSFEVNKGDSVGIIGRNGSGKSTLLQMICGTLTPTSGSITRNGRIAALLELGAGFNPDFTGRENIYLNGSILGLSKKEIDSKLADIIDFSEIEAYIDQQVKTYSSGMFIRLAFSVAIHSSPEILIIDEALAVGDVFFQQKCFERLKQLKASGITLLFVSHDVTSVKLLCNKAILLHKGELIKIGDPKAVVNEYIKINSHSESETADVEEVMVQQSEANNALEAELEKASLEDDSEYRYGTKNAVIADFGLYKADGNKIDGAIQNNESIEIRLKVEFLKDILNPVSGFYIKDRRGIELYSGNTHYLNSPIGRQPKGTVMSISFKQILSLAPGEYSLSLGLSDFIDGVSTPLDRRYEAAKLTILADKTVIGLVDLNSKVDFEYLIK